MDAEDILTVLFIFFLVAAFIGWIINCINEPQTDEEYKAIKRKEFERARK